MNDSLKNLFTVSDLRNRILFTLGMLAVYRVGHHITVPGVNLAALDELARQMQNNMFGLYDMFSGGNLSRVTIFALGIMPYISASIILQLLTVVWPYLEKLSKEGELGRRKITQYTRYGTIGLSVVQALGIAIFLERQTKIARGRLATIPAKMMSEIPLPIPRSVICSPSHMMKIVPVVSVRIVIRRKPQPGCGTSGAPPGATCFSSHSAIPLAWMKERTTVP